MGTRERIMMIAAEELPIFSIKTLQHSTLKTYAITIMSGRGPLKILP